MVPLALGSQTGGSTIRPASYCGIYGLKPTRGLIPRRGMSRVSQTLDTVGLFARTLEDVALLLESCVVHDEDEFESSPRAHTPYRAVAAEEAPIPPTFGFVKTPHWSRVDADAQEAFAELIEQKYDALLTPAATGIAPAGLASTGDPMFCSLWTLCGLPALSVPLMSGANGLPLGVQLVGARHGDGRLLRTARWLVDSLRRA